MWSGLRRISQFLREVKPKQSAEQISGDSFWRRLFNIMLMISVGALSKVYGSFLGSSCIWAFVVTVESLLDTMLSKSH